MGHVVHIENKQQFIDALRVLDTLSGTWQSHGPAETPVLLVLDAHYKALVNAGVISSNGSEGKHRAKKTVAKKPKS